MPPMAMTLDTIPVPTGIAEVRFADADGDGKQEILLLSHQAITGQPDAASLTVVRLGSASAPKTTPLGNKPLFLTTTSATSTGPGLWALGTAAWQAWTVDHFVASTSSLVTRSPLSQLGRATPAFADLAHDVFPRGPTSWSPARIAWTQGAYVCSHNVITAGAPGPDLSCGSVPAPARGQLTPSWDQGGQVLATALTPPPLAVTDADGDGVADLLIPDGKSLAVYYSTASGSGGSPEIGVRASTWPLPVDLDPELGPRTKGQTRRDIGGVWFDDVDGDHKVDLCVLRYVTDGSFFGATAEWLYARGTGSGFAAIQTVTLPSAAFSATLVDIDGDGDKDLVSGLVDVGMANLGRALISHFVRADLTVLELEGGHYLAPASLHPVSFPLDSPDGFHIDFESDIDGDKRIDLVAAEDGEVRIYRGTGTGMEAAPHWTQALAVPEGDGTLRTEDLDGDGRAEIVVWGKDAGKVWILRVPGP